MFPGPGPCSCHSPHLAISSLASLCFLVYKLGLMTLFLWDQVLMEEKSRVQGLAYIQQALKTRRSCLVKFHPSLKNVLPASSSMEPFMKRNGILLFPQDPLFLPFPLPFVPFSSSPPSHSPSAFALPIWNLLHWTWYYSDPCPGSVSHLWEHTFIIRKSLVWLICRDTL